MRRLRTKRRYSMAILGIDDSKIPSTNLCIIIPVYNEERRVTSTLERQTEELEGYPTDILICDDGSSDDTSAVVEAIAKRLGSNIMVVKQPHAGRGQAIRYSLSKCRSKYVAFSSADIVLKHSEIKEALRKLDTADLVMFSKARDGKFGENSLRVIMSKVFSYLVRVLFGVSFEDTQGVKIMPLQIAKQIIPLCRSKGFFLDAEMAIAAFHNGLRVVEQPWRYPYSQGSTVNLQSVSKMAFEMLLMRLRS